MEASPVLAPDESLTAVLENPPVTGIPLKKEATTFAKPNPSNS